MRLRSSLKGAPPHCPQRWQPCHAAPRLLWAPQLSCGVSLTLAARAQDGLILSLLPSQSPPEPELCLWPWSSSSGNMASSDAIPHPAQGLHRTHRTGQGFVPAKLVFRKRRKPLFPVQDQPERSGLPMTETWPHIRKARRRHQLHTRLVRGRASVSRGLGTLDGSQLTKPRPVEEADPEQIRTCQQGETRRRLRAGRASIGHTCSHRSSECERLHPLAKHLGIAS